jgi:hypothetical protein
MQRRYHRYVQFLTLIFAFILCFAVLNAPNTARAAQNKQVQLSVQAGYQGYYRANSWVPLLVTVTNTGPDLSGKLRVTGFGTSGLSAGEYTTDIDLPNQSSKQVFLYVTLGPAQQVKVELVTEFGVVADQSPSIKLVQSSELIYAVITDSPRGTVDLQPTHTGLGNAYQANWHIENVPDLGQALNGIDVLVLTDVDSGTLTINQRQAIQEWVATGGHLVVTGGPNWQKTQAGVTNLLPLKPNATTTLASLPSLAAYAGKPTTKLEAPQGTPIIVAQGDLTKGAQILAQESSVPLLARQSVGKGTVDYLAIDPGIEPYSSWKDRVQFWLTLFTSTGQQPSWSNGILISSAAQLAANLIQGLRLPDVAQLAGFLAIYIIIIGPLNYLILNRLGRREWAWLTIPLVVLSCSGVAFITGLSLRGTQATLNRLALVQVWPGSDVAQVDGVIGLLAPRRSTYTLTAHNGLTMRGLIDESNIGGPGSDLNASISQFPDYEARDVPVDAGLTAVFATNGYTKAPSLEGSAVITPPDKKPTPFQNPINISGTVKNTTGMTLENAVVLVTGGSQTLGTLNPGDSKSFSINISANNALAAPLTMSGRVGNMSALLGYPQRPGYGSDQTVHDVLGQAYVNAFSSMVNYNLGYGENPAQQEARRRAAFLRSVASDSDASGGRGDNVYLVGWTNTSPLSVDLKNASYTSEDTTVYIYQLPVTAHMGTEVEVPPLLMTWSVSDESTQPRATPYQLNVQQGQVAAFRFSPLPSMRIPKISDLKLFVQSQSAGQGKISLWNWADAKWEEVPVHSGFNTVSDPGRYIGPEDAVQVRAEPNAGVFLANYERIDVVMYGPGSAS